MPTIAEQKTPDIGYIRWKGLYCLAGILILGLVYFLLFFDMHLRYLVEKQVSYMNGAQVNIGSLSVSLLRGTIEAKRIEVTHHVQDLRNLFEFDRVYLEFDRIPLLRKKILIHDMRIEGVHFNTPRVKSGSIKENSFEAEGVPVLIDRVASGFYSEIRKNVQENPLRHLGELARGLDLRNRVEHYQGSLKSLRHLKALDDQLTKHVARWDKLNRDLPDSDPIQSMRGLLANLYPRARAARDIATLNPLKEKIREIISEATVFRTRIEPSLQIISNEEGQFQKEFASIEQDIQDDIKQIRGKIGFPRLDFADLTLQIIGPRILNYLERLSYWIDLSRRRMPRGTPGEVYTMIPQQRAKGISYHFGKRSTQPSFLIEKVTISSNADNVAGRGTVNATIEGLTTDPPIYGKPMIAKLEADFPDQKYSGIKCDVIVDHTKDEQTELIQISLDSFPFENWALTETSDMRFAVKQAHGSAHFGAKIVDSQLAAMWKVDLDSVEYDITSRTTQTEKILRKIVAPIYRIPLSGTVEGTLDKLRLNTESEIGKRLAEGLRSEYRVQIEAIDDDLRRHILDYLEHPKNQISSKLRESRERNLASLESRVRSLQEVQRMAEESLVRLERPAAAVSGSRSSVVRKRR